MRRKIVANDILLAEVAKMVGEGERVVILTKGMSMLPFIVGGRDSVELSRVDSPVVLHDILLAKIENPHRYVIHRVVGVDGEHLTLMGDGNIVGVEHCRCEAVVARVTSIIKPHKVVDPNTRRQRILCNIWQLLRPIRGYLLAILRRVG